MILKKYLDTSEDLEDDMKKGQQKFKALIKICFEDPNEKKFLMDHSLRRKGLI